MSKTDQEESTQGLIIGPAGAPGDDPRKAIDAALKNVGLDPSEFKLVERTDLIRSLPEDIDLDAVREEWISIGLSTEPADRATAEEAIAKAYTNVGLDAPRIEWVSSPLAGAKRQAELLGTSSGLGHPVYGQHSSWLSYYAVLAPVVEDDRLDPHMAAARSCGWWWPLTDVCVVSDRPEYLHFDGAGRLHHTTGKALAYRDGWGLYSWHGIRVPACIIEEQDKTTPASIEAEENAEYRRVMLDLYGVGRYLEETGAKPIASAKDEGGEIMRLYAVGDVRRLRLINSTADPDGSSREYWVRVPGPEYEGDVPDGYDPENVWHARNWTFGLPIDARFSEVS